MPATFRRRPTWEGRPCIQRHPARGARATRGAIRVLPIASGPSRACPIRLYVQAHAIMGHIPQCGTVELYSVGLGPPPLASG